MPVCPATTLAARVVALNSSHGFQQGTAANGER